MDYLLQQKVNYKYLVNCMVAQRTGNGFVTCSANYWDSSLDTSITVTYPPNNKKKTEGSLVRAIVTIYALTF